MAKKGKKEAVKQQVGLAKRFSIKWSIFSWLISTVLFAVMCFRYEDIMLNGGGRVYQIMTVLIGALSLYRLILIVYNIIQKKREK